jgi:hypothetical protein
MNSNAENNRNYSFCRFLLSKEEKSQEPYYNQKRVRYPIDPSNSLCETTDTLVEASIYRESSDNNFGEVSENIEENIAEREVINFEIFDLSLQ